MSESELFRTQEENPKVEKLRALARKGPQMSRREFLIFMGLLAAIGFAGSYSDALAYFGGIDDSEQIYNPERERMYNVVIFGDSNFVTQINPNTDGSLEVPDYLQERAQGVSVEEVLQTGMDDLSQPELTGVTNLALGGRAATTNPEYNTVLYDEGNITYMFASFLNDRRELIAQLERVSNLTICLGTNDALHRNEQGPAPIPVEDYLDGLLETLEYTAECADIDTFTILTPPPMRPVMIADQYVVHPDQVARAQEYALALRVLFGVEEDPGTFTRMNEFRERLISLITGRNVHLVDISDIEPNDENIRWDGVHLLAPALEEVARRILQESISADISPNSSIISRPLV